MSEWELQIEDKKLKQKEIELELKLKEIELEKIKAQTALQLKQKDFELGLKQKEVELEKIKAQTALQLKQIDFELGLKQKEIELEKIKKSYKMEKWRKRSFATSVSYGEFYKNHVKKHVEGKLCEFWFDTSQVTIPVLDIGKIDEIESTEIDNDTERFGSFQNTNNSQFAQADLEFRTDLEEKQIQLLFSKVIVPGIKAMDSCKMKIVDTHTKPIVKSSLQKPDFTILPKTYEISTIGDRNALQDIYTFAVGTAELKKPQQNITMFNDNDCGQLCNALVRIAMERHDTQFVYGFLCDFHHIQFFKYCTSNSWYQATKVMQFIQAKSHSDSYEYNYNTEGFKCLISFLSQEPAALGYNLGTDIVGGLVLENCISHGATSYVFASHFIGNKDKEVVAKICNDKVSDFAEEIKVLTLLQSKYETNSIKHFPKVLQSSAQSIVFERLQECEYLNKKDVINLIHFMQQVHVDLKIGHRDIRPENLMTDARGNIVLIDWGFAASLQTKSLFAGTVLFCADDYLSYGKSWKLSTYSALYDLESIVKSLFIMNKYVDFDMVDLNESDKFNRAKFFWEQCKLNNTQYRKCIRAIKTKTVDDITFVNSYEALIKAIEHTFESYELIED